MAMACPHCGAAVDAESVECPQCRAELDEGRTILPKGPRPGASARPSGPGYRPERAEPADRGEAAAPPPRPRPKHRPKPPPPAAPRAATTPREPLAPPPAPPPVAAPPPAAVPAWSAPPIPAPAPSGVRGFLIRMLGGQAPAPAPTAPPAPPGSPPPYAYPPGYPAYGPPPIAPPPAPEFRPEPSGLGPPGATAEDEDGLTVFAGGIDLKHLKIPKHTYYLQILDASGTWADWGPIHAGGLNVGRAKDSAAFPGLGTMAVRHMRFSYEKAGLTVQDLGSLNGVYLRVAQPVELADGMRFRVGSHVIEFRRPEEPFDAVPPRVSEDGEEFTSRDLEPLAFLDLIRPDGRPGLRFPITKTGATVLGREGDGIDIALTGDRLVSKPHAAIRRTEGGFTLEDLGSRNGTYYLLVGPAALKSGDVLSAGRVVFRVLDRSAP